jgi:2-polyprenyl-6-methoxyphenol hydroxylase-like FAD-dependent oxidoreductase
VSSTGWAVTVLEQAPELRALGAGITLAPNAVRALEWLGLGQALRECGAAQGPPGLRTWSGQWLMHGPVDELEARFGVPSSALHRSDLLLSWNPTPH